MQFSVIFDSFYENNDICGDLDSQWPSKNGSQGRLPIFQEFRL